MATPPPAGAPRGPLQGLADLNEIVTGHKPDMSTFLRGLVVGAFVGAAIAGSTVLRRWRQSRRPTGGGSQDRS
jgi:hypothetical protein